MARVTVDFSETTVFVAGGTSGINLGIAEAFATAGARVAVMSRSKEKVDAAVSRLQALGAQATGGAADVRDPEATSAVLQLAHAAFGDIDVLVSGAAGNFPAAALDMSPNAFRSVVDIDLLGSYHVLRAAYPLLRKPGAVVINVSAPQAFLPMALQSHVCAAKAGVDMMTRVLAIEWGRMASGSIRWSLVRSRARRAWSACSRCPRLVRSCYRRYPRPVGVNLGTSPTCACSWHRPLRTTSPASSCPPTAAGHLAEPSPR